MTDKEFKLFKKWLKGHLAFGPVTITFTKKDGSEREMKCTTSKELVPQVVIESNEPKKEKKPNEDVYAVYDLEAQGWRSFRWESVKTVTFEL